MLTHGNPSCGRDTADPERRDERWFEAVPAGAPISSATSVASAEAE
jgi:hypothetical protein